LRQQVPGEEILEEIAEEEREAREIRRRMADWEFIEKQPPRIREALRYYIETGDIRRAAKLAGLGIEEFRELLRRARVPVVV